MSTAGPAAMTRVIKRSFYPTDKICNDFGFRCGLIKSSQITSLKISPRTMPLCFGGVYKRGCANSSLNRADIDKCSCESERVPNQDDDTLTLFSDGGGGF